MTRLRFLGVAHRNTTGDLDDATSTYGIDGPAPCDCDYAPAGHTEDQCAYPETDGAA